MTKKQFGIIFTLLALIVCVGVLAAKLNQGGLNDPSDLGTLLEQPADKDKEQEVSSQSEFFVTARGERDQADSAYIQSFKAILEDKNTTQEQKNDANKKITDKTVRKDQEKRIEMNITNKGFEDALCFIEDGQNGAKARVVVKAKDGLDEKTSVAIQEIVQDVAKTNNIVIEVKK
ncbi:MAG: SpoIIIAH-like family protein [Clostridium sp.]